MSQEKTHYHRGYKIDMYENVDMDWDVTIYRRDGVELSHATFESYPEAVAWAKKAIDQIDRG